MGIIFPKGRTEAEERECSKKSASGPYRFRSGREPRNGGFQLRDLQLLRMASGMGSRGS